MKDYDELNNGVFHQTLFLPNKGQTNIDMARLDSLMTSPCIDWSLMGNSFFTFVHLQFITIGISVFTVACFWGFCFGELPRSWDYFVSERFWLYREFNPNIYERA